jgi:cellulase/cellobiase CelA1
VSCAVTYSVTTAWQGGFQASVTVANTGSAAINGWTLAWNFAGDQQVTNLWNATVTQTGGHVSATAAAFDATIAPGTSVNVGFTANGSSAEPSPTAFTVNGTACGV